jgi:hypothetical protein
MGAESLSEVDEVAKVTVWKVRLYDAVNDAPKTSKRMATELGAKMMGGEIVTVSGVQIEASLLNGEQWTDIGFDPDAPSGFAIGVSPIGGGDGLGTTAPSRS